MNTVLKDIETENDLKRLFELFYKKAEKDEIIGNKFDDIDIQSHIPIIVNFWNSIIFSKGKYSGSPFDKHLPLNLEKKHFDRWLYLFETTVYELFHGDTANLMVKRAYSIGAIFLSKIEYLGKYHN